MSDKIIAILRGYESLGPKYKGDRWYPYQGKADRPGIWTCGFGHVMSAHEITHGVRIGGQRIDVMKVGLTEAEADQLLHQDLIPRITQVKTHILHASDQEVGAFLDMLFNCGTEPLVKTPGRLHNNGDKRGCALSMPLYIWSAGKRRLGLWRRRLTDALYYLTGELMIAKDDESERRLTKRLAELGYTWVKPTKWD
jgi:GH24 family phage-related lysozyme (muramidase)